MTATTTTYLMLGHILYTQHHLWKHDECQTVDIAAIWCKINYDALCREIFTSMKLMMLMTKIMTPHHHNSSK